MLDLQLINPVIPQEHWLLGYWCLSGEKPLKVFWQEEHRAADKALEPERLASILPLPFTSQVTSGNYLVFPSVKWGWGNPPNLIITGLHEAKYEEHLTQNLANSRCSVSSTYSYYSNRLRLVTCLFITDTSPHHTPKLGWLTGGSKGLFHQTCSKPSYQF